MRVLSLVAFLFITAVALAADPPLITSVPPTSGTVYQAVAVARSKQGVIAWSLVSAPAGTTISAGGLVDWSAVAGPGRFTFSIEAVDPGAGSAMQSWAVEAK